MRDEIDRMLARCGRVATRSMLFRQGLSRHQLDDEVRSGALVTVAPRTYCRPWNADEPAVIERGALMSVGRGASLSHSTALRRWGLIDEPAPTTVHVTVPANRTPRGSDRLVVHRVTRYPPVVLLDMLVTVSPATAVVTSWPLLVGPDQRGPAIAAVRQGSATPGDLRTSLDRHARLPGRRELNELIGLLADGCESELEIWGHSQVFDVPACRTPYDKGWSGWAAGRTGWTAPT